MAAQPASARTTGRRCGKRSRRTNPAEASEFWSAFFNPTYFPSLFLRALVCLSLAGVWGLISASRIDGESHPQLKTSIVRWSVRWLFPAFLAMPIFFLWYLAAIPPEAGHWLQKGVSTIGSGAFTQPTRAVLVTAMTTATILAVLYFFAYRQPRDFSLGQAVLVLFLALAATAATEQAREMLRKPFVVGEYLYSSGVRKSELDAIDQRGYLTGSPWVKDGDSDLVRGELVFVGQCIACHTREGYRPVKDLLAGRDRSSIANLVTALADRSQDAPYPFMPPLVGTVAEREALINYLHRLAEPDGPQRPAVVQRDVQ